MFIHIYGEQRCMGAGLSCDAALALSHVKVFVAVSSLQTGTVTAGKAALVTGSSFDAQKPNKVGVQVSRQFHMPHTFSVRPAIKKLCFKTCMPDAFSSLEIQDFDAKCGNQALKLLTASVTCVSRPPPQLQLKSMFAVTSPNGQR